MGAWIEILYARGVLAGSITVAPLVGAWIEICITLTWELSRIVAPLVGAWIEINRHLNYTISGAVAPLVGAWIEIQYIREYISTIKLSLPLWERGLK